MTPPQRTPRTSLVYSSDTGRVRETTPPPRMAAQPTDGVVRVGRTKAGRGGKTVTLVTGLPPADVGPVAKELKRLCGTGGTVKDGTVEIQGDHRQRIVDHLATRYRTKLAGG
jgi:translation initiation factor 1